jgi:hypothetical protein
MRSSASLEINRQRWRLGFLQSNGHPVEKYDLRHSSVTQIQRFNRFSQKRVEAGGRCNAVGPIPF